MIESGVVKETSTGNIVGVSFFGEKTMTPTVKIKHWVKHWMKLQNHSLKETIANLKRNLIKSGYMTQDFKPTPLAIRMKVARYNGERYEWNRLRWVSVCRATGRIDKKQKYR
jgi:hypothetical protein